ncbi:MAG: hypothetical protein LBT33_04615 [Spirochaetia bacterium]|nr:hypothetical protein [Spirochaetia bacterium]
MKKHQKFALLAVAALSCVASLFLAGCMTGPELGPATPLQQALNELPAIPVAGKELKFEFGGDAWIAKVDGKNSLAGTFTSEDTADGSILTLEQTHAYSNDIGWVATPGPQIVLEYKKGPPASLAKK